MYGVWTPQASQMTILLYIALGFLTAVLILGALWLLNLGFKAYDDYLLKKWVNEFLSSYDRQTAEKLTIQFEEFHKKYDEVPK
jgi:hypothetical protein